MKTRIAIVIPARLDSTRLTKKLTLDKTGYPLLTHTIRAAETFRQQLQVYYPHAECLPLLVATDGSPELAAAATIAGSAGCKVNVVETEPSVPSGTERVAQAVRHAFGTMNPEDVVINFQGDHPTVPPEVSLFLVRPLFTGAKISTVCDCFNGTDEWRNSSLVKVVTDSSDRALYFSRQPIASYGIARRHIGLYAFRPGTLRMLVRLQQSSLEKAEGLEQLRWLQAGYRIVVEEVTNGGHNIDTVFDYERFCADFRAGNL